MKKPWIALVLFAAATTASAQISQIRTTRRADITDGLSIGPRLANYSTDLQSSGLLIDTGRQTGFGLVGDYRAGKFVLDFMWAHDPQNGFSIADIIVDIGGYERDRIEGTVGYAIAPNLDLQGGIHVDNIRVGGTSFFGNPLGTDLDLEHQALIAGVRFHTGDREPVGFYLLGRGLIGTADFNLGGFGSNNPDTAGFRGEAGVSLRLGQSKWYAVPGIEYETIKTDRTSIPDFDMDTNRVFVSFVYRTN